MSDTNTTPATNAGDREAVARAYQAGAEAVHKVWADTGDSNPPGDPDFWEAAHDYADANPIATTEYARGLADGVKQSEAAIVAWLRTKALRAWGADCSGVDETTFAADAIERGEHAQEAGNERDYG